MDLLNIFRVFTIGGFALMAGQICAVLWAYVRYWYRGHKAGKRTKFQKTMPLYLALITLAFLGLSIGAFRGTVVAAARGTDLTLFSYINPFLFLIANIGLAGVIRFERSLPTPVAKVVTQAAVRISRERRTSKL